jgi:hypothetical protein
LSQPSHNDLILDQFTRQATPFSTASPITDAAALKLIVETSGAKATDTVLDVACGGGVTKGQRYRNSRGDGSAHNQTRPWYPSLICWHCAQGRISTTRTVAAPEALVEKPKRAFNRRNYSGISIT